jgi:hypothetical protein
MRNELLGAACDQHLTLKSMLQDMDHVHIFKYFMRRKPRLFMGSFQLKSPPHEKTVHFYRKTRVMLLHLATVPRLALFGLAGSPFLIYFFIKIPSSIQERDERLSQLSMAGDTVLGIVSETWFQVQYPVLH